LQRKKAIDAMLAGVKPLQSGMTDSVSIKAIFIDIPIAPPAGKSTETFLVSNLAPSRSVQRVMSGHAKSRSRRIRKRFDRFRSAEPGKRADKCEVFVRDIPACDGPGCTLK
jgi:hypothetical protein